MRKYLPWVGGALLGIAATLGVQQTLLDKPIEYEPISKPAISQSLEKKASETHSIKPSSSSSASYGFPVLNELIFNEIFEGKYTHGPRTEHFGIGGPYEIHLADGRKVLITYDRLNSSPRLLEFSKDYLPDQQLSHKLSKSPEFRKELGVTLKDDKFLFKDEGNHYNAHLKVINTDGSIEIINDINGNGFKDREINKGIVELIRLVARYPDHFQNDEHIILSPTTRLIPQGHFIDTIINYSNGGERVSKKTVADLKADEILEINVKYREILRMIYDALTEKKSKSNRKIIL